MEAYKPERTGNAPVKFTGERIAKRNFECDDDGPPYWVQDVEVYGSPDELILQNADLPERVVSKFYRQHSGGDPELIEELQSVARIALVRAARRGVELRPERFPSYAIGCMLRALREEWRRRDPLTRAQRQRANQGLEAVLPGDYGRRALPREICSLDAAVPVPEGEGASTLLELHEDPDAVRPDQALEIKTAGEALRTALNRLPDRLRAVIEETYLSDCEIQEVARRWRLHPSRLTQLRKEALKALRKAPELKEA
ncbi:MAG: sigma-70 family RNA polymerase sigma factor [Verrucomicrobia bacterium]|nr:sigma-70 family RNA polymerase sigma factor [Verrucomicrobiota bacterium]